MSEPVLTPQQRGDIDALGETFVALSSVFDGGDATPATLCMCSAALRRAAETLDEVADAWIRQETA